MTVCVKKKNNNQLMEMQIKSLMFIVNVGECNEFVRGAYKTFERFRLHCESTGRERKNAKKTYSLRSKFCEKKLFHIQSYRRRLIT